VGGLLRSHLGKIHVWTDQIDLFSTQIASNWFLTAAHCVVERDTATLKDVTKLSMVLGAHDLEATSETRRCPFFIWVLFLSRKTFPFSAIIIHKGYTAPLLHMTGNDIALIRVAQPVNLAVYSPACLPPPNTDFAEHDGFSWNTNLKTISFNNELRKPHTDLSSIFRWGTVLGLLYALS
jgi:secreted trypsin-like serine protease